MTLWSQNHMLCFCGRQRPEQSKMASSPTIIHLIPGSPIQSGNMGPCFISKLHLLKASKYFDTSWVTRSEQAWESLNCLIPYLIHFLVHKFPLLSCSWKDRTSHLLHLSWLLIRFPLPLTFLFLCSTHSQPPAAWFIPTCSDYMERKKLHTFMYRNLEMEIPDKDS